MLELLDVEAGEAVMVGDTFEDDVEGALAVGMRAILVDREGRYPDARRAPARPRDRCLRRSVSTVYSQRRELAHLGRRGGRPGDRRGADTRALLSRAGRARRAGRRGRGGARRRSARLVRSSSSGAPSLRSRSCGRSRAGTSACRRSRAPAPTRSSAARASSRTASTPSADACASAARSGRARSYLDGEVFAEGQTVDIIQIEGVTALVAE